MNGTVIFRAGADVSGYSGWLQGEAMRLDCCKSPVRGVVRQALCVMAAVIFSSCCSDGYAVENASVKTQKGLNFAVPEDWPIEERGGALAPVSVEEYVSKKFKAIEARLDDLEKSLSKKQEVVRIQAPVVKSAGDDRQTPDVTGLLEALADNISHLKAQVEALKSEGPSRSAEEKNVSDKNIIDQIRLLKSRLDSIERRLGTIEFHQDI